MQYLSLPLVIHQCTLKTHRTLLARFNLYILGEKIVVVRCEEINISGPFYRNKLKYLSFLRKRCNINPKRGPFHYRAPRKIFWRTVRGMLPHLTHRGSHALSHLKVHDGVPPIYNHYKRMVLPDTMRIVCLKPCLAAIMWKLREKTKCSYVKKHAFCKVNHDFPYSEFSLEETI
ncbi:unnamed protein product [Soboliphyme baturini]|uniref:Large ribosomal subunit protein uL13 n=1 Tax=Soboliphyme baturini TaxID=241478 RepID=A0A183J8P6_9BILA|nr:unnamed protein product [Soboliphyme baturini]